MSDLIATLLLAAALAQPADSSLLVTAVRFYRADPTQSPGVTQVTAMLRIPDGLPQAGPTGEVSLGYSVRVMGDSGVLYEQSWRKRTALPFPRGDADRLDLLRFNLASGSYHLEARVVDSVSGRAATASVPIDAYAAPPPASDLLLSTWARQASRADSIPHPGEFRKGNLVVAIAPDVAVGGSSASVAYLLETYAGTAVDGTLTLVVVDGAGAALSRTAPTPVRIAAGIGLVTGRIDVGDLEPGSFTIRAELALGGQPVVREARFEVDPAVAAAPASISDQAYFSRLSGSELDRAFGPLRVIAGPKELDAWPATGTDAAKRGFLASFWRSRDRSPVVGNERRARFYDGVRYAATAYAEPGRELEGWETDRGRIFLREGLAPQVLRRPARPGVPAFEVWRYFDRPNGYYIFASLGAEGTVLIRSNDRREKDRDDWQAALTPTGLREVVGFVGRVVLQ
ncbi:MAG: GWxTD domain-containing protein [Gemmatimonadales bacterium]